MNSDDFKIQSLEFRDFRNYEHLLLTDLPNLTILVGKNGVGKTNILEGIQLLTSTISFKHPQVSQLIREGTDKARLATALVGGERLLDVALYLEEGRKNYQLNGKSKKAADMRGILPSILFTPDDLELAKKTSRVKRDVLDTLGSQLSKSYYVVHQDYEKVVRYKNRLLKEEAVEALLDSIDETLITCGSQLYCYRVSLFNRMIGQVAKHYEHIAQGQEAFEATYTPSWLHVKNAVSRDASEKPRDEIRALLEEALSTNREEERRRARSLIGPHNDQISFNLGGRDVADFASQGQQRSVVLAWKLAEVDTVKQVLGQNPVLLLDDVMSELDEMRRAMLVEFVSEETQTFITTTDLSGFNDQLLERAQIIELPLDEGKQS